MYANVGQGKNGGILYIYGTSGDGKSWTKMVCVWQHSRGGKLQEYGICIATLEKGKPEGIR